MRRLPKCESANTPTKLAHAKRVSSAPHASPRLAVYTQVPILEEYILVNTLRAKCAAGGGRILTLPKPALCSPRRWEKANVWRINAVNQAVMIWYRFGATPEQVFEFYYGRKVGA